MRTALLASDMFLRINGYGLQNKLLSRDEVDQQLQKTQVAVTANKWDAQRLALFYEGVATRVPPVSPEARLG